MANDTRKQYTEASSLPALESVSGNEKVLTLTENGNAANATPVKNLMAGVFKAAQEAASPSTNLYVDLSDAQGNVVSRVKLSDLFTLAAGAQVITFTDLNNTPLGIFAGNIGSSCENKPEGFVGGMGASFKRNDVYQFQILVDSQLSKMHVRLKWGQNWLIKTISLT